MRKAAVLSVGCVVLCSLGCGLSPSDESSDGALGGSDARAAGLADGTAESCGVLRLASEATLDTLDVTARLDRRAAQSIVGYRLGPDAAAGTDDDQRFDSLAELDAVGYVGKNAFQKLRRYAATQGFTCEGLDLQILSLSDFHGQLDPLSVANVGNVGGAAALASLLRADRRANPNTLLLNAGDSFGASPPLASFFEERPAVMTMNALRVDADNPGNHGFDRGLEHLAAMAELADYPLLSANLDNVDDNMSCPSLPDSSCIRPYVTLWVGGVKVAVVGLMTDELPAMVKPGTLGTIEVTDPVAAAEEARAAAAAEGAQVFIAIAHIGGFQTEGAAATGPLIELAAHLPGFDVVVGGHTHVGLSAVIGGTVVVQNKAQGLTYSKVALHYDFATGAVADRHAELVTPLSDTVTADPAIVELLAPFRTELAAAFDGVVATSEGLFERGNNVERLGEVPLGNLVADAIRARYETQIAFVNGGGLRSPMPSSYAPRDTTLRRPAQGYAPGIPYDLVVGDIFAVLPFGNDTTTTTVTGAQIWRLLEHSVEGLPDPKGWFAQISGMRFTFDSSRAAGSRVVSVTLTDGTPIAADETVYTMATSDFLAAGGDGYTILAGGSSVSQEKMADVLLAYVRNLGQLTPARDGRVTDVVVH